MLQEKKKKKGKNEIGQWILQDGDPFSKAVKANAFKLEPFKGRTGGKGVEPTQQTFLFVKWD